MRNCWLLLYKHKHLDYLQHITGHFPEKHKARSDSQPNHRNTTQESVAQCISCTYNDWQHKSSAEVGKCFCCSSLHKYLYFTVLNLHSHLPRQALKSKLFSNSTLHLTHTVCTKSPLPFHLSLHDLGKMKHFCLCLLTSSGITIIVSFVQGNALLLRNEQ